MDTERLKTIVLDALDDLKATDVKAVDVRSSSDVTDIMIIASGTSNRQVRALSNHVIEKAKEHGVRPLGVEGQETSDWILVDLGDVVVHIMQPRIRDFYQLERLWNVPPREGDEAPAGRRQRGN